MVTGNTNFGNDAGTGTVGADGFLGPLTGALTATGTLSGETTTGITAHAGGTQAAGFLLTTMISEVATVGTAADSVLLPVPTKVGQIVLIVNSSATSMQVFGSGTDTINAVATATGVAQAAGKSALYFNTTIGTAAKWWRLLSA